MAYIPLVTLTLIGLEMGRRDLTNRVCLRPYTGEARGIQCKLRGNGNLRVLASIQSGWPSMGLSQGGGDPMNSSRRRFLASLASGLAVFPLAPVFAQSGHGHHEGLYER